jgi:hypothetical protein
MPPLFIVRGRGFLNEPVGHRQSSSPERFVTRPVGRASKFLVSLAFYIVVSVVIIVVCPARDNIGVRVRRHYLDTAVALTVVGVDPDTTWTDANT